MYGPGKITSHAASGSVKASGGFVHGIWVSADAVNPGAVRVRDGGASGEVKIEIDLIGAVASPAFHGPLPIPVQFNDDIYVEVGANAAVQILWE